MALVMLPTTILLAVGMLPSVVCFVADKTKNKAQTIAVAAFNLAACTLFLLRVWTSQQGLGIAMEIVLDPLAIVVMYMGAAGGYAVDIIVSSAASAVMYKKTELRQQSIKKTQKELIERWGEKVTGRLQLDRSGFPVEK
jgi:hypothetical protein